jgi:hypothetical protein
MVPRDSFIAEICEGQVDLYGGSSAPLGPLIYRATCQLGSDALRPILDANNPHPQPLHHLDPCRLGHGLPLPDPVRPHHLQHPSTLDRCVRCLHLRPRGTLRAVGCDALAGYRGVGPGRGGRGVRVRNGRLRAG